MAITDLIPDPEDLLALEPEELAGTVLKYLIVCEDRDRGQLNRHNFGLIHTYRGYPDQFHDQVGRALMEAWAWLERECLIAHRPGDNGEWFFVTRRGKRVAEVTDQGEYRRSQELPKRLLHPVIAQKSWAPFLRGDFDAAVFRAFKEIEVAIRNACGYPEEEIGVSLIRKAFDENTGNLTDLLIPMAERQAMAHMFAGAIGLYKNPSSHRNIEFDIDETARLLLFASHLLSIVNQRRDISETAEP